MKISQLTLAATARAGVQRPNGQPTDKAFDKVFRTLVSDNIDAGGASGSAPAGARPLPGALTTARGEVASEITGWLAERAEYLAAQRELTAAMAAGDAARIQQAREKLEEEKLEMKGSLESLRTEFAEMQEEVDRYLATGITQIQAMKVGGASRTAIESAAAQLEKDTAAAYASLGMSPKSLERIARSLTRP